MTHIAISEHRDGTTVQWMEHVSDGQYNGSAASADGSDRTPARPDVTSELQSQPASQPPANRPSGALQQRIAPGLATLTDDVLFGDVWRRPDLSPRDRSLVTISILIATGKPAQLAGHLGRALTTVYSRVRLPACWRTWRSTADGRVRFRHWRSTSRFIPRARSIPAHCVPWPRDFRLAVPTTREQRR